MKFTVITLTLVALVAGASAASCPSLFPHDTVWGEWNLCCDYIGPNDVSIFLCDVANHCCDQNGYNTGSGAPGC
ncbi:hypothetical protein BDV37DRAFT_287909 [Aspergillus pseudonomiae]|uniref:Uncharacterized protein n=1 Tax=Aspergillus pseudonomiae TaxID=1506151 RepID=A0A5N7CY13_9EURO|nr:uncharacterized protein BDV37DRAFT_287909 [Aspergillus pseudonomiae]KAE8399080.1 hypothetical protein BDV37DRAFT_287909 [Aspergillus pseudonomiae]